MKQTPLARYRIFYLFQFVILATGFSIQSLGYGAEQKDGTRLPAQQRTLSFAERVAYQRAIEEVYWNHRIWPKENPGPKPSLDELMPASQIEKKVTDYLHASQMLEDQWLRPITSGQLQAEVNRMANHTKQPDVLHELFAVLGNDPFVIAECLAKPTLVARLAESFRAGSGNVVASSTGGSAHGDSLPDISVPLDCANDSWTETSSSNVPEGRRLPSAVWTGTEMIVWGGAGSGNPEDLNSGGRYNPSTDSWNSVNINDAPTARQAPTAVWTGREMVVWGGYDNDDLNTGGRYNPITDSWTATNTNGAPTGRFWHTAVWTGAEMIVWGGVGGGSDLNTGGRYNPSTDNWMTTSTSNAPDGRRLHTAVWTGTEMIVWGGTFVFGGNAIPLNTGGRYDPSGDNWTATSTTGAPGGRWLHTAVWTGTEMVVWGGNNYPTGYLNTGGRYGPSNNSWTTTSSTGAPTSRSAHTAVWTGSEMIIWGGLNGSDLNTGGRHDPSSDSWAATTTTNAPTARRLHSAVWTGAEMIVWGGYSLQNSGGRYCAQPSIPIAQSAVSRKAHGSAGAFDIALPLNGTPGIECRSGGATNDYTIMVTFLANVSVTGNPQSAVASGTATIGTGGISNGGNVIVSSNVVTIPLTNVANAQTISVTLNGVNGSTDVAIPMSILAGDVNGSGAVNASDLALSRSRIGQTIDGTNFRSDVNANGTANSGDVALVKSAIGTALP